MRVSIPSIFRDFHFKGYDCGKRVNLIYRQHQIEKSGYICTKIKIVNNTNQNDSSQITPLSVRLLLAHLIFCRSPKLLSRMPPALNTAASSSFSIATFFFLNRDNLETNGRPNQLGGLNHTCTLQIHNMQPIQIREMLITHSLTYTLKRLLCYQQICIENQITKLYDFTLCS